MRFDSNLLPLKFLTSNKNRLGRNAKPVTRTNVFADHHKMGSVSFLSNNDLILVITAITANSVSEL